MICKMLWSSIIFLIVNASRDNKFFDLNRTREIQIYKCTAINYITFNKNEFVFITGNDGG